MELETTVDPVINSPGSPKKPCEQSSNFLPQSRGSNWHADGSCGRPRVTKQVYQAPEIAASRHCCRCGHVWPLFSSKTLILEKQYKQWPSLVSLLKDWKLQMQQQIGSDGASALKVLPGCHLDQQLIAGSEWSLWTADCTMDTRALSIEASGKGWTVQVF